MEPSRTSSSHNERARILDGGYYRTATGIYHGIYQRPGDFNCPSYRLLFSFGNWYMRNNTTIFLVILVALVSIGGTGIAYMHTRGFRNNNPGNLKAGPAWLGVVGVDSKGFAIFDTMENGVRAIAKDLTAKMNRGLTTIRKIITVYAPPSENPTQRYIDNLSDWTRIHPDQPLTYADFPSVISGIIRMENGKTLDSALIKAGIAKAGINVGYA